MRRSGKFLASVVCSASLISGCAQTVRPAIRAGSNDIDVPRLQQVTCTAGGLGEALPTGFESEFYIPRKPRGEAAGLLTVLLTSLIGKGVDLIGSKLKERGEEQTLTLAGQLNIDDRNMRVSCFDLSRNDGLLFRFALLPSKRLLTPTATQEQIDHTILEFVLISLNYPRSIDLEVAGTRGLSLKIEALRPNETETVSQTISLGNVEVGSRIKTIPFTNNPFTSAYFQSPFVTSGEEKDQAVKVPTLVANLPFTMRVELTEVRNANAIYKIGGEVVDENSDAITAALIKLLSDEKAEEPTAGQDGTDTGQPPVDQPPGL